MEVRNRRNEGKDERDGSLNGSRVDARVPEVIRHSPGEPIEAGTQPLDRERRSLSKSLSASVRPEHKHKQSIVVPPVLRDSNELKSLQRALLHGKCYKIQLMNGEKESKSDENVPNRPSHCQQRLA